MPFVREKGRLLIFVTVGVASVINLRLFILLAKHGKCLYRKNYWVWSLQNALPLLPHYLSEVLLGHADRIMINSMCGSAQAAIYNIAYQISMVMTIIRQGINASFIPWLYYSLREKRYERIREITKILATLMCLMSASLMLMGPELLRLAAPPSYYEAVADVPAIMIGCYCIFIYIGGVYSLHSLSSVERAGTLL